jgi:hypothetical protein
MLKAFTPVSILIISAVFKIQKLNQRLVLIVIVSTVFPYDPCPLGPISGQAGHIQAELMRQLISTGCALAAYGEINFAMFGFLCQIFAVGFESSRLVMIQILLQGLKVRNSPFYLFSTPLTRLLRTGLGVSLS